jgi:DNA-binding response OmpR family regulator
MTDTCPRSRVLIVDDDRELATMLAERLSQEGWLVETAHTGSEGSRAISRCLPDVVLLDVMLPDAIGWDLCRRWRAQYPALGLLMLTARGDPMERVLGLEIGADDYLSKPFDLRELVARLRALLRRQASGRDDVAVLRYGPLSIDLLKREVRANTQAMALTGSEFKLLVALARAPGRALAREELNEAIQLRGYKPLDRTVDVQVARLRRKLRAASPGTDWIDTVRGEGYMFVARG